MKLIHVNITKYALSFNGEKEDINDIFRKNEKVYASQLPPSSRSILRINFLRLFLFLFSNAIIRAHEITDEIRNFCVLLSWYFFYADWKSVIEIAARWMYLPSKLVTVTPSTVVSSTKNDKITIVYGISNDDFPMVFFFSELFSNHQNGHRHSFAYSILIHFSHDYLATTWFKNDRMIIFSNEFYQI